MTDEMRPIAMGVHVLDVLVRPVEEIPEGQGGQLVEQIRITAAGSAGGAALVLAELRARARRAGAGWAHALGGKLPRLLARDRGDTSLPVRRTDGPTAPRVLPIPPPGGRP